MAVAIAAATFRSFIAIGLPILRNTVGKDLRDDVESISSLLNYIVASFRDRPGRWSVAANTSNSNVEDQWLKDMNLLAYAMEDLIDCFLTKTPLDIVDSEAAGFLSPAWRFAKRMVNPRSVQIGKKIRRLKQRLEEARTSFDRLVVKKGSEEDAPAASTQDEAATHVVDHVAKDRELLQHLLRTPSESEKKLTVISIVGYGALGNTLLVNNVYGTNEVQNRFSRRTRYNAAGKEPGLVIKEISAQVTLTNQNGGSTAVPEHQENDEGKAAVLKHHKTTESTPVKDLKGKAAVMEDQETENTSLAQYSGSSQKDERYLLVIDNVDMDKLLAIINSFDNVEGGIIIVVTTDYTEAIHCKCTPLDLDKGDDQKYIRINDLTNTVCKEEAIFREETGTHKQKLKELLVHNYNKSLSSLDLEHCLLYFCMFPRHLVRWNLLIRRYRAEGIDIGERDGELRRSLEIFIDHHAVQVSENGEVKRCQFPVMMLNHISCESNSSNFLTSSCGSMEIPTSGFGNPVRRLSLHQIIGDNGTLRLPDASVYRCLRTLAVFHTGRIANISKLSRYKLLRVLDMKECPVSLTKNQLKKICNLLLLKYLSLGDSIDQVPREIAKLRLLQTLAMTKTKTVYVPVEVMELPVLKHLLGKFQLYKRDITKKKLKQLLATESQLQSLSGFVVGDSEEFRQVMSRMNKLRKVKIWCDAEKLTSNVTDAIDKFTKEVPSGTRSLSLECNGYPSEIVKCLRKHGFLTSLKLRGDLKTHLDVHVDRPIIGLQGLGLKGITMLCLEGTNLSGDEIVRLVTLFLSLEYLKLVEDNLGELKIPAGCLYSLKRLCLVAVSNLDRIIISEDTVLCFLVSLHMLVNTQCDLSGIDIDKLKKLNEITLYSDAADQREWQRKASRDTHNPKVLFIQRPNASEAISRANC
uniref:Uncharacterized protein n=2 Tax=Avena sativa TaxID=4498 RepID=A0ACD5WML2_AVESA